jgi:hypothetical protein
MELDLGGKLTSRRNSQVSIELTELKQSTRGRSALGRLCEKVSRFCGIAHYSWGWGKRLLQTNYDRHFAFDACWRGYFRARYYLGSLLGFGDVSMTPPQKMLEWVDLKALLKKIKKVFNGS